MIQPCACRHIRSGDTKNDGTGLCARCKNNPIIGLTGKERKAKGLQTGPR